MNVDVYKSHSTRITTASKALELGVSIDDILDKFYNRSKHIDIRDLILSNT